MLIRLDILGILLTELYLDRYFRDPPGVARVVESGGSAVQSGGRQTQSA